MSFRTRLGYWLLRWPVINTERRRRAARAIKSNKCVCGQKKLYSFPFCKACSNRLSDLTKGRLNLMLRRGFVLAYEDALKELTDPATSLVEP